MQTPSELQDWHIFQYLREKKLLKRLKEKDVNAKECVIRIVITLLDLGYGPGSFTTELARLAGEEEKVIVVDLQQGMLKKVIMKIRGTILEQRVKIHKCPVGGGHLTKTGGGQG